MLEKLLRSYAWYDHPEGLKFVETHRDEFRTSGHWLMLPGAFSAFHRVNNNEELWYIHQGRITLHIIEPDGRLSTRKLGADLSAGEEPALAVPQHCWQAAEIEPGVPYAFGSVVCAPAFQFTQFEIAERAALLAQYPAYRDVITRLTLA
ncbi:MAG: cupin domain-containing protein [Opitutae bacterium]|nr:cupin domain-containing protein [Opitutae bacterium]